MRSSPYTIPFSLLLCLTSFSGKPTGEELESSWYIIKAKGHYMLTSLFIVVKGFLPLTPLQLSVVYVGCTETSLSVSSNTMELFVVYTKMGPIFFLPNSSFAWTG